MALTSAQKQAAYRKREKASGDSARINQVVSKETKDQLAALAVFWDKSQKDVLAKVLSDAHALALVAQQINAKKP